MATSPAQELLWLLLSLCKGQSLFLGVSAHIAFLFWGFVQNDKSSEMFFFGNLNFFFIDACLYQDLAVQCATQSRFKEQHKVTVHYLLRIFPMLLSDQITDKAILDAL